MRQSASLYRVEEAARAEGRRGQRAQPVHEHVRGLLRVEREAVPLDDAEEVARDLGVVDCRLLSIRQENHTCLGSMVSM